MDEHQSGFISGCKVSMVAQLVKALRYKLEGHHIRFPVVSLEFFIDIILLAAL